MAGLAGIGGMMSALSAGVGLIGSFVSAQGTIAAGKAAKQAADYEAAQLNIKAKEEQAAAQREAEQHGRRRDLALSSLTSRAAASGFTATDPTTLTIADEITKYGTTQEQMAMYGGTSRRAGTEAQAHARRMEGEAALAGAKASAKGTIIGGMSTLFGRFAGGGSSAPSYTYRYG